MYVRFSLWPLVLNYITQIKNVGVILIDFSKPFDSVCHSLLAMLRAYDCQKSAIRLIRSSLSDRFERVKCNGFFWIANCGVSQGRLLVREFCTRNSFLFCRRYQFFSLKISTQANTLLQLCLRRLLKFFSSRHLCLWTRERFRPTVTALDNC